MFSGLIPKTSGDQRILGYLPGAPSVVTMSSTSVRVLRGAVIERCATAAATMPPRGASACGHHGVRIVTLGRGRPTIIIRGGNVTIEWILAVFNQTGGIGGRIWIHG